jgi:L-lactate dehydrogenase complex protein LldF
VVLFQFLGYFRKLLSIVKFRGLRQIQMVETNRAAALAYSELPFSSTLNGSCSNVCPVKINIHEQIYAWRAVMDEKHQTKFPKKEAMIVAGKLLSHPEAYRIATQSTETALKVLPRFAIYNHFNAWGRHREVPAPANETFHEWYRKHRST